MPKIIRDLLFFKDRPISSAVTIGNFDGVHKGHQRLLLLLKDESRSKDLSSVVITFDPHPLKVLTGNPPLSITPLEQKIDLLASFSPDYILILHFDKKFANLEPEDFVKTYLVDLLSSKVVIVGHDYRFGKGGRGDFELLKRLGQRYGFEVKRIDPVTVKGEIVSSTKIRKLVQEGEIEKVRDFLGRFYEVRGVVVQGQKRGGPLLGVPTANLKLIDELYPKVGVYAVFVIVEGKRFLGVANVGFNPTFGKNPISVEAHIFDFSKDIYGKKIRVQFVKRLRDEKKFPDIESLKKQIFLDIQRAKEELKKIL